MFIFTISIAFVVLFGLVSVVYLSV
jgi:hypothetical protein